VGGGSRAAPGKASNPARFLDGVAQRTWPTRCSRSSKLPAAFRGAARTPPARTRRAAAPGSTEPAVGHRQLPIYSTSSGSHARASILVVGVRPPTERTQDVPLGQVSFRHVPQGTAQGKQPLFDGRVGRFPGHGWPDSRCRRAGNWGPSRAVLCAAHPYTVCLVQEPCAAKIACDRNSIIRTASASSNLRRAQQDRGHADRGHNAQQGRPPHHAHRVRRWFGHTSRWRVRPRASPHMKHI
jgi:hypothetical protein